MMGQCTSPCGCGSSCEIVKGLCEGLYSLGKASADTVSRALEMMCGNVVKHDVYLFEMPPSRFGTNIAQVDMRTEYSDPVVCTRYYVDTYEDSEEQRRHRLAQLADAVTSIILSRKAPDFIDDVSLHLPIMYFTEQRLAELLDSFGEE